MAAAETSDGGDTSNTSAAGEAGESPTRADFDQARRGLRDVLTSPRAAEEADSSDGPDASGAGTTYLLSPENPPEGSDTVLPLAMPVATLDLRSSPLSPQGSPTEPTGAASFRAAASASGVDGPVTLAFGTPTGRRSRQLRARSTGTQRRRGLLAACSTPRSSTPRVDADDLSVQYESMSGGAVPDVRDTSASALLEGLSSPAADTLSGGVHGLYRWPVTHMHRPEPVSLAAHHAAGTATPMRTHVAMHFCSTACPPDNPSKLMATL